MVSRKAQANLDILLGSPLAWMLPVAAVAAFWLLRPGGLLRRSGAGPDAGPAGLAAADVDVLRAALLASLLSLAVGAAVNDSGVALPATAAALLVPLLVWLAAGTRRRRYRFEGDRGAISPSWTRPRAPVVLRSSPVGRPSGTRDRGASSQLPADEVRLRHRRRCVLSRQGTDSEFAGCPAVQPWPPGHDAEAGSLPQRRSRNDEPVPARRGLRHRGRRGDRPGRRSLRALPRHRPRRAGQRHHRPGLLERDRPGAARRVPR